MIITEQTTTDRMPDIPTVVRMMSTASRISVISPAMQAIRSPLIMMKKRFPERATVSQSHRWFAELFRLPPCVPIWDLFPVLLRLFSVHAAQKRAEIRVWQQSV